MGCSDQCGHSTLELIWVNSLQKAGISTKCFIHAGEVAPYIRNLCPLDMLIFQKLLARWYLTFINCHDEGVYSSLPPQLYWVTFPAMSPVPVHHPETAALGVYLDQCLSTLQGNLLKGAVSSSSNLTELSQYYFQKSSKRLRPRLVVLISIATQPDQLGNGGHLRQISLPSLAPHLTLAQVVEMIHVASVSQILETRN